MTEPTTLVQERLLGVQPPLIPESVPARTFVQLPLEELPASDDPVFAGRQIDTAFMENVALLGILEPILVVADHGTYRIEDGRRRIIAARALDYKTIPAMVVQGAAWDQPGVIGLSSNTLRSDNLYGSAGIVFNLVERGFSMDLIASTLRIRKQRVRYLLKFAHLIPPLKEAFGKGAMKATVAEEASSLTTARQEELVAVLAEKGRITWDDVHEVRSAVRTQTVAALDLDLEDVPITAPEPRVTTDASQAMLRHVLAGLDDLYAKLAARKRRPKFDLADIDALRVLITAFLGDTGKE